MHAGYEREDPLIRNITKDNNYIPISPRFSEPRSNRPLLAVDQVTYQATYFLLGTMSLSGYNMRLYYFPLQHTCIVCMHLYQLKCLPTTLISLHCFSMIQPILRRNITLRYILNHYVIGPIQFLLQIHVCPLSFHVFVYVNRVVFNHSNCMSHLTMCIIHRQNVA